MYCDCPFGLEILTNWCPQIDKLHEDLSRNEEYGLSWPEFIDFHYDEWFPLAQKYWNSLCLERQIELVNNKKEYVETELKTLNGWLDEKRALVDKQNPQN